jgi:hypothetical protein
MYRAQFAGVVAGKHMWQVQGDTNYYLVYDGKYTAHRMRERGQVANFSIMHPRYAGLRQRIDAAIAAAV